MGVFFVCFWFALFVDGRVPVTFWILLKGLWDRWNSCVENWCSQGVLGQTLKAETTQVRLSAGGQRQPRSTVSDYRTWDPEHRQVRWTTVRECRQSCIGNVWWGKGPMLKSGAPGDWLLLAHGHVKYQNYFQNAPFHHQHRIRNHGTKTCPIMEPHALGSKPISDHPHTRNRVSTLDRSPHKNSILKLCWNGSPRFPDIGQLAKFMDALA